MSGRGAARRAASARRSARLSWQSLRRAASRWPPSASAVEGDPSLDPRVSVSARDDAGAEKRFEALLRIDTPNEAQYWRHGGILQYVLRKLLQSAR